MTALLEYELGGGVRAFTAGRDVELPCAVVQPHQTHSTNVAYVNRPELTREELEGVDALVTDLPGVAIGVRTADCIPVLLYDPVHKAVGAAHSGWRGTVNMISKKAVMEMYRMFGTRPEDIRAVVGPGIGYDSFQIGEEVALTFKKSGFPIDRVWSFRGARKEGSMEGGHHIDLKECVRFSLTECGVLQENITVSDIDTYTDARFFSARREGISCGRNINAIMLEYCP
ncbi:MAG: peptidoglycan editing factor PgeF [Candidatus Cryptobacteroides sp.]